MVLPALVDERSLTSNQTVERLNQKLGALSALPLREPREKPRKRLRFNLERNEYYPSRFFAEDLEELGLWFRQRDYNATNQNELRLVKKLRKIDELQKDNSDCPYPRLMEAVYRACILSDFDIQESGELLSPEAQYWLQQWMDLAPNRIGIEHVLVRKISKDQSKRRYKLLDRIFSIQEMLSGEHQIDKRNELISETCEFMSRPAKCFALILAEARANSSLYEPYLDDA